MIPFRLKLLESFNFSILDPHVKFQPTSNESLIKQTRNSMCDRCEFPLGQDVGLETRRLDTTELKVLEKSLYPTPKEKQCILHVPKKKPVKFRDMEIPGSSLQVLSLPSFLHISHSLIFFPLNFCIHSHHKKNKMENLVVLQK